LLAIVKNIFVGYIHIHYIAGQNFICHQQLFAFNKPLRQTYLGKENEKEQK
jgi:hypothetical protein